MNTTHDATTWRDLADHPAPRQPLPCAHGDVNGDAGRCPCRHTAREHLTRVWVNLLDARIGADNAARTLSGSRAARAAELADKIISDAIAHVQRLRVVVEGDERAEQAVETVR